MWKWYEKTGTLSFLAPNLSTVLATINFQNVGIFRLEDAPARRKREDNARCRRSSNWRMELAVE
jgi:hypothetical protein